MSRKRTAWMAGMFDMHNFGDLMFPLIAEHRLASSGWSVQPVSPTGARVGLTDAFASVSLNDVLARPEGGHAVIIGGGYILHGHRMDMLREYRHAGTGAWAGPASWLGATLLAAMADVPVVWNAPGAPHPLRPALRELSAQAMRAADYLTVRDQGSLTMLGTVPEHALIVPDTVLDLPQLWSAPSLEPVFKQLVQRLGLARPERVLAVHVRRRSLGATPVEAFAAQVSRLCQDLGT